MASLGLLVPSLLHHTGLLVSCPSSVTLATGTLVPICGILDLDVDQRGIKRAYWLKAASMLKPQRRGDCGGGDGVWAPSAQEESGKMAGSWGSNAVLRLKTTLRLVLP